MEESKERILQADKLNRGAITRCGWDPFVAWCRAHFVHPSAAIVAVSSDKKAGVGIVQTNFHIKSTVLHLLINPSACILFSKDYAIGMSFKNLYDQLAKGFCFIRKFQADSLIKYFCIPSPCLNVVLYRLEEKPGGVTSIKTGINALVV